MFGIGPTEMIVIFLILLIMFGAKRLPELARSLGQSIKEFKHATQGLKDELDVNKIEPPTGRPLNTPGSQSHPEAEQKPKDSAQTQA
ncbi:MAG: twin-arginine translocase TatA/TatE family subunit [Calditrichaeota bacterium]|nr:MAG: twin-arginine translocase TatA/TatE family subunit [Calditrichota bacterium]